MNDKELRQFVLDELEYEPSIDSANIGVTAEHGVITLSGHVADYAQKVAAERAAWRVKGVKAIAQEIEVRLSFDKKQNDDEIAQRILNILAWNTVVPKDAFKVKVSEGWVTLTGQVHWHYQREAAAAEVRKLTGVKGVINDVKLAPAAQIGDVKRRIQDALKRYAEIEAKGIRVEIKDGSTVRIEGQVDNWDERQAVERAAWSAPGVRIVEDHLTIG
ncbi:MULTISPECIES: BON domain-containing protein [unclassified Lysobacter]|uniref:BON domain-containing protein n=1 Tax=unclassified Lysobacter TaxID=2635362 RepID=UPI0006FE7065|nr:MULTISPECIES: BON domain-containing protein [unclassified Lysobacter]KQZ56874.1 ornithine aminotransferase [Lysobacter sp. Root559]KRC34718.1 ornithine aminotransferase [Lysobacter sp. Root76]KRD70406.1 ornithine aminotransferase [Lysobacter sp. Root96]